MFAGRVSITSRPARRRLVRTGASLLALTVALSACGGGDGGGAVPDTGGIIVATPPPAPPPAPPPPPPVTTVGAVYAGTNGIGAQGNQVVAFRLQSDGTTIPFAAYATGGTGRASPTNIPPRLNPLIGEDSILPVDDRFLLVVNAGSNDVSSMRINADFSLTEVDREASGGTMPLSLAHRNGVIYVAHADEDGVFTTNATQSGNITALRIDPATGQLTRIAGFSLALRARPTSLEVSPDGRFLLATALNSGSSSLPAPTGAEITSLRILADGTLDPSPAGAGMSTPVGNAAGRNLPNAIGMEVYSIDGRQYVIVAEARTANAMGVSPTTLAAVQTGSVSTWEIAANGGLIPREQDFMLGPTMTSGPIQASFVAVSQGYDLAMVASSAGGRLSGIGLLPGGMLRLSTGGYQIQGNAADVTSPTPLANADGFADLAFDPGGNYLFNLVGLRGRLDTYQIVFSLEPRQQIRTDLFPTLENLQGLAVVVPRRS